MKAAGWLAAMASAGLRPDAISFNALLKASVNTCYIYIYIYVHTYTHILFRIACI